MSARPRPPRGARLLLRLFLSADAAEVVSGDLDEAFDVDLDTAGRGPARRRYWQMTLRSLVARWRPGLRASTPPPRAPRGGALVRDVQFATRQVRRAPGFAAAMIGTLALGIAAATTVFGLANALVLAPLAYEAPDRVVFLLGWNTDANRMSLVMRYSDVADLAADMTSIADTATFTGWNANVNDTGVPERLQAYAVSANTFDLLGVPAAMGRTLKPRDADGDGRVAVLSHGLWTRRYGADPAVVGRETTLDGEAYTVVGVMPSSFEFPIFNFKGDVWTPLQPTPGWTGGERAESPSVVAIARLRDSVSVASAEAEAVGVMARLATTFPDTNRTRGVRVVPMADLGNEQTGPVIAVLGVTALLVLLIACANAAGLQLARGLARESEMAVRAALGASRWRLVRQFLVESLSLAVAGGLAGAALAWLALEGLRGALPEFLTRMTAGTGSVRVDLTGLAFASVASVLTVLIFGALPAWRASSPAAESGLRTAGRASAAPRRMWLRSGLVVGEVAIATALVVLTGLLARTAQQLADADPGFDKSGLLAFNVSLAYPQYSAPEDIQAFYTRLGDRLLEVPGVTAVASVNTLPFSATNGTVAFARPGDESPSRADYRLITPTYLRTLGISVLDGRAFTTSDDSPDAAVVLVNEAFVRQYFPDRPPLGRELLLGPSRTPTTIVGVAADSRHWTVTSAVDPVVYQPMGVAPRARRGMVVRTDRDPAALIGAVRSAAIAIDPQQALYDVAPMAEMVGNSFVNQRIAADALVGFGAGALLLTSFGLYALLAFVVASRKKEIGVRVALGAQPWEVTRTVLRRSLVLCGTGLAIGLGLAMLGARALASQLFGVGPLDPASYLTAAALIGLVALAASWLPVLRALRVDPIVTLRYD